MASASDARDEHSAHEVRAAREARVAIAADTADTAAAAPLRRLYEDERLLIVDKPAGLLVHRSALDAHEPDNAIDRLHRETGIRYRPVHRLDKGTSGVLVFARDVEAASLLGAAFESGRVTKRYIALVRGWPEDAGRIDYPLARDPERPSAGQERRDAATRWCVLARFEWPFAVDARHASARYALVDIHPETGRRHQIRRHFKQIGHPLIGDATHGKGVHNRAVAAWLGTTRLWLHAAAIVLPHPDDGRPLAVEATPGPEWDWRQVEPASKTPPSARGLQNAAIRSIAQKLARPPIA